MNIFISYPRELIEKAEVIEAELSNEGYNVFIDRESIFNSEVWKQKIQTGIRKSDVFVILYNLTEEESKDARRFINTEIKDIRRELKRKRSKRAVLVLFKPGQMLPYFRIFNNIIVKENDTENHEWTNNVIHAIRNIKIKSILMPIGISAAVILAVAILSMLALNISYLVKKPDLCAHAGSVANHSFVLKNSYLYLDETIDGIRYVGISREGSWDDVSCKREEDSGGFVLTGNEKTHQLVKFYIDGEEVLGESDNSNTSTIVFDNGEPSERTFTMPTIKTVCTDQKCTQDWELKKKLEDKYDELVKRKHVNARKTLNSCESFIMEKHSSKSIYIVSVCDNYTRIMQGLSSGN